MKKVAFLFVAFMVMCVSFAANAQETSRTVIISNFSSRAVKQKVILWCSLTRPAE